MAGPGARLGRGRPNRKRRHAPKVLANAPQISDTGSLADTLTVTATIPLGDDPGAFDDSNFVGAPIVVPAPTPSWNTAQLNLLVKQGRLRSPTPDSSTGAIILTDTGTAADNLSVTAAVPLGNDTAVGVETFDAGHQSFPTKRGFAELAQPAPVGLATSVTDGRCFADLAQPAPVGLATVLTDGRGFADVLPVVTTTAVSE